MPILDATIAEILAGAKIGTKTQIEEWLTDATRKKKNLSAYVTDEHILTEEDLGKAIAESFHVRYTNLQEASPDSTLLEYLPAIVAKKYHALVFRRDADGIHCATANPSDDTCTNGLKKKTGESVIVYYADEKRIDDILAQVQGTNKELTDLIEKLSSKEARGTTTVEDAPIVMIVDKLLELGHTNKASDIHIEPEEDTTHVRFRIDGILHDIVTVPKTLHDVIVTRIKILSKLRTDEHYAAQDGKMRFKHNAQTVDIRVSIVPVVHGEKIVLRLLSERSRQFDLENLGYREDDLEKINRNIKRPWGMILATGPTGSGKTTTLYGILKKLNRREVNISTIEDPVEYDIEGANQIQVNPKTNLTFATGLRAIVRQDPNIIMVGEIRDEDTAKIAVNAAMTGHLVLSTLHTNDAATSLPRLLDMGIQPFLVASTVDIIIAQRLVRKICDTCRHEIPIEKAMAETVKKEFSEALIKKYNLLDSTTKYFFGQGCDACQETGYAGRVGIYEVLEMSDTIKQLIMSKANANDIKTQAVKEGMRAMIEDGIEKVLSGVTTLAELFRVTQE